jgi:protein-tyrosine phosphatase
VPDSPAEILLICTANICRSPSAELLLRSALDAEQVPPSALAVSSAGLRAREDEPIARHAAALLDRRGIDVSRFRSHRLGDDDLDSAHLLLTASREHKSAVLTLRPRLRDEVFTLREFAWLLADLDRSDTVAGIPRLVQVAAEQRGLRLPRSPGDFDLDDPFGRRRGAFRRMLRELDEALAVIVPHLAGAVGTDRAPRP